MGFRLVCSLVYLGVCSCITCSVIRITMNVLTFYPCSSCAFVQNDCVELLNVVFCFLLVFP